MTDNRKRNHTLTIRLSKTEKEAIAAKARKAKLTLTEYIIALSRDKEIVLPPDISPLLVEMKRIGNNLNQIATKVNSGVVYVPNLKEIISQQKKIYELLLSISEVEQWRR